MDTLQLFMAAISIIVSTRSNLTANDCPEAHVAAGVPIGVVINKTVGRNDDLARSFVDFATRRNKGNCLLSGRRGNQADRSRVTTVHRRRYGERARQKGIGRLRSVVRPSQGIVYSLSWNFGPLRERTGET